MMRCDRSCSVPSVFGLLLLAAGTSAVWPASSRAAVQLDQGIATWNVGSGQPKDHFTLQTTTLGGQALELGLRTVYRTSLTPPVMTDNTYTVQSGNQVNGEYGAQGTRTDRNRWNFDYHVFFAGGVQNLDSLILTITSPAGNTPATTPLGLGVFDLKVANNDNVTGSQPFPAGDSQDPAFFIQDSQNPVFAPWFNAPYDMLAEGLYTFTITATLGAETQSVSMNVSVVPEPATLGLAGVPLLGLLLRRRRQVC